MKTIKSILSQYSDDIVKDIAYQLRTPKRIVSRKNLKYVSPYFYNQHDNEAVVWHRVMTFEEYKKRFQPRIEDTITAPDEYVLVMVLDYVA